MIVVTFTHWRPPARYDDLPWTEVRIQEAATELGAYATIDTIALDPLDDDPSDPQSRSFTTELGTAAALWYRLVFADATADTSPPTDPIQNVEAVAPYATVAELARILKVDPVAEATALSRVLMSASTEIDAELGLTDSFSEPPDLVVEVALERAVEHWQQMRAAFGVIGLAGVDQTAVHIARDTWDRHAHKLAPLKETWGFA